MNNKLKWYVVEKQYVSYLKRFDNKIESDKFYINMAEAWLVCELYIKYPNKVKKFIAKNNLNKFTQNKAISKIHDSYRVSKEDKEMLNGF